MDNLISYLTSKFIPQAAVVILVGTTLTTGGLAGARLLKATELQASPVIAEVKSLEEALENSPQNTSVTASSLKPTTAGSTGPSVLANPQTASGSIGARGLPTTTAFPVAQKNAAAPAPASGGQTGCIITLFGKQYDVTPLRSTHSGGDIFNCGTDMTASYQGKHGTDMSRMQPYLVQNTTGATGTTAATGTIGNSNNSTTTTESSDDDKNEAEDENEEESEAEKQRYEEAREAAKQTAERERENADN